MLKNIIKSFMAGFIIGLAGCLYLVAISQEFRLLPALLFPVGLFLICTFSFNLYTGKIGYIFDKEKNIKIIDLIIMVIFNFIGAVLVGLIYNLIFSGYTKEVAEEVAYLRFSNLDFKKALLVLLKSTLCGVFVYIAVYLFSKSQSEVGKMFGVWIPIFTFAYLGLDHSIANMFYMSAGMYFEASSFILILVAILGNSIGAILFDLLRRKVLEKWLFLFMKRLA